MVEVCFKAMRCRLKEQRTWGASQEACRTSCDASGLVVRDPCCGDLRGPGCPIPSLVLRSGCSPCQLSFKRPATGKGSRWLAARGPLYLEGLAPSVRLSNPPPVVMAHGARIADNVCAAVCVAAKHFAQTRLGSGDPSKPSRLTAEALQRLPTPDRCLSFAWWSKQGGAI